MSVLNFKKGYTIFILNGLNAVEFLKVETLNLDITIVPVKIPSLKSGRCYIDNIYQGLLRG